MRYGIMAMQMGLLIPAGKTGNDLLTYVMDFDHAALVSRLVDEGFNLIELGGDLGMFFPQTFFPPAIDALLKLKKERNLRYTIHLPLWSVEPSTPQTHVREGSTRSIIEVIQVTMRLEPECYVLHATGALAAEFTQMRLPDEGKALILRLFQSHALQSLKSILEETDLPSRKLAIETIEFPFDMMFELAEALDLSVCLDTGHILAGFSGKVELFDVLEKVLPRLGEIHLHDCPSYTRDGRLGYGKDHQPLGTGDLDVARILKRLEQADYQGPIIFELSSDEAKHSIQYIKTLKL
jgi:sugar phosphate isomerase/epimerase